MSSPLPVPPPIQLASSDSRAWDEQWQRYFTLVHAGRPPTWTVPLEAIQVQTLAMKTRTYQPKQHDDAIRYTRSLRQALCEVQVEMTREAAPYFQGQDLPQRWMSAAPEKRGEIILAGLAYTCSAYGTLNQARYFCEKEMDVESHRRDGRLFLDLLQGMMGQNPTTTAPEGPTYISHPVWDALAADEQASSDKKLALTVILAERNMLIGFVTLFTSRSFLNLPIPQIKSNKGPRKPVKPKYRVSGPMQNALNVLYGEEAAKGITKAARENERGDRIQAKERYAGGKQHCRTCEKPIDTTTKYPRCKRCWDTLEREVPYCSAECQRVDWKARHKKECGRLLQLEDLTSSAPEQQSSTQIGPPLPGFKRSGALIFQVAALNKLSPEYDYIIFLEYDRVYVSFPHPSIRSAFRACRDKAVNTGDRRAVAMLAQFLLFVYYNDPRPQQLGVDPGALLGQILTEFDFPEIVVAENEMQRRMCSDVERRPPLILDGGVSAAEWKAKPSTWVDVGIVPR